MSVLSYFLSFDLPLLFTWILILPSSVTKLIVHVKNFSSLSNLDLFFTHQTNQHIKRQCLMHYPYLSHIYTAISKYLILSTIYLYFLFSLLLFLFLLIVVFVQQLLTFSTTNNLPLIDSHICIHLCIYVNLNCRF